MEVSGVSLLRQWDLLTTEIVPLLEGRIRAAAQATVWAARGPSDAVAVSAVFAHAHPDLASGLRLYTEAKEGRAAGGVYTTADLRSVPVAARYERFQRTSRGWYPSDEVAECIFLGPPNGPVDLIIPPEGRLGAHELGRLRTHLRRGGCLVLVGGDGAECAGGPGLEPVSGHPLLRRTGRSPEPAARPEPDPAEPGAEERPTLARLLLEDRLVDQHVNLARSLARRFSGRGEPIDDLRQVAFTGLVLAARRYDPAQNTSFSTYATATILGELKRYFRDRSWMMRVPRTIQETYLAIKVAREELYQELSRSPTIQQLAARVRVSEEAVLEAIEAGDNFTPQTLDVATDQNSASREIPVEDPAFDRVISRSLLKDAMPRLPERQRLVLKLVYLDGWTQRRVAEEIGVSQMQVSRLLRTSTDRIKEWVGS